MTTKTISLETQAVIDRIKSECRYRTEEEYEAASKLYEPLPYNSFEPSVKVTPEQFRALCEQEKQPISETKSPVIPA